MAVQAVLPTPCSEPVLEAVHGHDEGGSYTEQKTVGHAMVWKCFARTLEDTQENRKLLASALRLGPVQSIRQAVTRLVAHRHLASDEAQLALLLRDYAADLSEFPEFVVHAVCDHYRRNEPGNFMPKVAAMRQLCASLTDALRKTGFAGAEERVEKSPVLEEPPRPTPETSAKLTSWMDLSRRRSLTSDELDAWKRGEAPAQEVV